MIEVSAAEEKFYSQYTWCLNPALSVKDLLRRFEEEVGRYEALSGWRREESKANLYLFVCAIACTVDDYFGTPWLNLSVLSPRLPRLGFCIRVVQALLNLLHYAIKLSRVRTRQWRRRWDNCIEEACKLAICRDAKCEADHFQKLRAVSSVLARVQLPAELLKRRMRLPEAFRSQDMAHHDVLSLIQKFCAAFPASAGPVVVLGLRTAGAYFAPLMAEYLKKHNFQRVSWFSIRPKNGTTLWEQRRIRRIASENARVLVVDDYPSSGNTFRITLRILQAFAVKPEQIVVLAPTHPAHPKWREDAGIESTTPIFTICAAELFKARSLVPEAVASLCSEYFSQSVRIRRDQDLDAVNRGLARHSKDGHHVREKRVFAVEFAAGSETIAKKVFLKSVGWGWLGYHGYIVGKRLNGFVPDVIGLRNGLLLTEWIEDASPDHEAKANDCMVRQFAFYVAARSRRLPLSGDCQFERHTYRWTGSDEIVNILRAAYGPYINRLKLPALRKQLNKYGAPVPALVDGRMRRDEWIHTPTHTYKVDFEHHNFGGGELDIVDPAYDLAAAIFEFGLSKQSENELLRLYAQESGDTSVDERILLHKILYGSIVIKAAQQFIAAGQRAEENNARLQSARNFLVYAMNDFCAALIGSRKPARWSDLLFFMDLDNVFDQELLGFPHASNCGLKSLALLHAHEFSVVLNTGRSVQHVRQYCNSYGLAGGLAEFGSVFIDGVDQHEVPLIDSSTAEQLKRCRDALRQLPGVFIDPSYEYSIRTYRFSGGQWAGLSRAEVKTLLKQPEFSRLSYICRGVDTYIVKKGINKAAGLRFVRRYVGEGDAPVTAIGDSVHDIGMLKAAEFAYAPGNCSPVVRELSKEGGCHIVTQKFQSGLLASVKHRLRQMNAGTNLADSVLRGRQDHMNTLMQMVLKAADRRSVLQLFMVLLWWNL